MPGSKSFFACLSALLLALLFAVPRPALGQTDPRWGLLSELVEHDFQLTGMFGKSTLFAYRWEEPGKRMSMIQAQGPFSQKYIMTLDPSAGTILIGPDGYQERYGYRVTAAGDGTLLLAKNSKPYLARGGNGTFKLGANLVIVAAAPGSPASLRAAKLIAAGKLRAANFTLPTDVSAPAVASVSTRQPAAGTSTSASTIGVVPAGADVELSAVQRQALDRLVNATVSTTLVQDVPGFGREGMFVRFSRWVVPGKAYITQWQHDADDAVESRYVVRGDGTIVLAPEDEKKHDYGMLGRIDPAGNITFEWHVGANAYRRFITADPATPGAIVIVNSANTAKPGKPPQWTEVFRETGSAWPPETTRAIVLQVKAQGAMKANPWGALSVLPGTLWYCVGYEPEQWLMRRRIYQGQIGLLDESVPAMRLTVATWRDPGRTMEVITKLGDGRGWTDTITLQPDGSFAMSTTGVSQYAQLTGRKAQWGNVVFPIANYNSHGGLLQNWIEFSVPYVASNPSVILETSSGGGSDPARCDMRAFDKEKLSEWTAELAREQESIGERVQRHLQARDDIAAEQVEGQKMIAGMQADLIGTVLGGGGTGPVAYFPPSSRTAGGASVSPFLQELRDMADIAHRDAEASGIKLQETLARARRGDDAGTTRSASDGGSVNDGGGNDPAPSTAAGSTLETAAAQSSNQSQTQTYYSCVGTRKVLASAGGGGQDRIDTMYYGIVTSRTEDIHGATALFRQHTGSGQASNTEDVGADCHPYPTRAEAVTANQSYVDRDSNAPWKQVTNIELSL